MSDTWDKLAVSKPVDRQTALSNGGGLGHTWSKLNPSVRQWDDLPQTLREPVPGSPDYRGLKFGRLTVVGLLDRLSSGFPGKPGNPSRKPAKWLVRCVCGRFEHRQAKAFRAVHSEHDRCEHCRRAAIERRRAWSQQTGRNDRNWWDF